MVSVVVAMQPYPADHARTMKMQLRAQSVLSFHAAGELDEMKLDTRLVS
jgi:hypothetical protein